MNSRVKNKNYWLTIGWVMVIILVLALTAQRIMLGDKTYGEDLNFYTQYNNYIIFKNSFFHLINNQDLYKLFPTEQWDLYKYSPAFALFMGGMAYLPDWLGLFLWNFLNAAVLFFALWKCPIIKPTYRVWLYVFIIVEAITSLQNSQSNMLMAGLLILAFNYLEKRKNAWAVLFIALSAFVKIYGGIGFILVLFYPNKFKSIGLSFLWMVALAIIPLLVISPSQLIFLYKSWAHLLLNDHSTLAGISVVGLTSYITGLQDIKTGITLLGLVLFLLPLLRFGQWASLQYRLLYLASALVWVVIFNHMAESPTFIIAVAGVALWYFSPRANFSLYHWRTVLMVLVFVFTSLSVTDIFPADWRRYFLVPYSLKVLPVIIVWVCLLAEQLVATFHKKLPVDALQ